MIEHAYDMVWVEEWRGDEVRCRLVIRQFNKEGKRDDLFSATPDTFFVQAASGTIFGTFDEPGQFGFSVMAVDASGKAAEVEKLSFDVLPKPQFKIATTNVRGGAGDGFTDPGAPTTYIVGSAGVEMLKSKF